MRARWIVLSLLLAWSSDALARRGEVATALIDPSAEVISGQLGAKISLWTRGSGLRGRLSSATPLRGDLASSALVGVFDGHLRVHRGEGYRQAVSLPMPRRAGPILRTAISPDGRVAAAIYAADGGAGDATAVSFFDARRGRRRGRVVWQTGRLFGARFSRDGRRVALFGDVARRRARVDVYALGERPRRLFRWESVADKTVFSVALAADGRRLAIGAGRRLVLLALPSGRRLAARPTRAALGLFPPRLRRLVARFPGAHQLVFSPDGARLAALHAFGVSGVSSWKTATLTPEVWLPRPASRGLPRQLAFDKRGRLWLVAAGHDPLVELFVARLRGVRGPRGRFVRVRHHRF